MGSLSLWRDLRSVLGAEGWAVPRDCGAPRAHLPSSPRPLPLSSPSGSAHGLKPSGAAAAEAV